MGDRQNKQNNIILSSINNPKAYGVGVLWQAQSLPRVGEKKMLFFLLTVVINYFFLLYLNKYLKVL